MDIFFDETQIKKKLRRITIISVLTIVILSGLIFTSYSSIKLYLSSAYTHMVHTESNEIAVTLKREILGDLNAIKTLAIFTKDAEMLKLQLPNRNLQSSNFDIIGFWNPDGSCTQVSLSGVKTNTDFSQLALEVQIAIIHAFEGQSAISDPYFSTSADKRLCTVCVPIRDENNDIIAVLSGAKDLTNFNRTLLRASERFPEINSVLVTRKGKIVAKVLEPLFQNQNASNIFDLPLFNDEIKQKLNEALQKQHPSNINIQYLNNDYTMHVNPIVVNDWFLITLEIAKLTDTPGYSSLIAVIYTLAFLLICGLISAIVSYIYIRRGYNKQLELASFDLLTGAYNIFKFKKELSNISFKEKEVTLIALNIRDFHYLNEIAGTEVCNEILKTIVVSTKNFKEIIYKCRTRVDQFYLLITPTDPIAINKLFFEFIHTIENNLSNFSIQLPIVFYASYAISSANDNDSTLLHKVDFVQKQMKKSYVHKLEAYDDKTHQQEKFIKQIEGKMRQALENDEFKIYLQPKIEVSSGKLVSAEAVVRWHQADGSIIFPNSFISIFEENGFCVDLDLYNFQKICLIIKQWQQQFKTNLNISINQSMNLLLRKDYIANIHRIIDKTEVDPKLITIEILESIAAQNINELINCVNNIHFLGLQVALDDFGSGYSSLNVLAKIKIDELKFDKEFLLEKDPIKQKYNEEILRHMTELAASFNIKTVAEGCETAQNLSFLKKINCNIAQGFFFDKPLSLENFIEKYLTNKNSALTSKPSA
ncbi:EAL domain-containing protein [Succinatimonas hippei]|uniref:Cyclic diguanylate phosphodiesterase (EAL) domain protein n=1 Tax=Succinatimonas hippei (strain DSM 22608 / JCM 16073 / KCTC 15190 / YIT 12066) TaxID=762983 RepID=E8LLF4_SUCHY|nr:EAL domain-containing protein [Succinatimonas hippei]EFY06649.1 cyclic diguanylate phosphodiesterase (EAL) domain protein [Succinatimonas hippei YIT 12066]